MAKNTKESILREAKENGVEFVRLQFTDLFGVMKNIAMPVSQLEKALNNECMFDGSSKYSPIFSDVPFMLLNCSNVIPSRFSNGSDIFVVKWKPRFLSLTFS